MKLTDIYSWEIEVSNGTVIKQYEEGGGENSWKKLPNGQPLPLEKVIRISIIPKINLFPKHDCLIDISKGEKFIRRFGRGFLTSSNNSISGMKEYLHCVETNRYRMWVFSSSGRVIITRNDYEIYL